MSDVKHEYDGIIEEDNQLPRWWLGIFFVTIVFAVGYWFYFHVYGTGELPIAQYQREKGEELARQAEKAKSAGEVTPEVLAAMAADPMTVAEGQKLWLASCASCHRADGGGQIGPNLTDGYWIGDGSAKNIAGTIRGGRLDKGMPAWGPQLGEQRVRTLAAFVWSLRDKNVAGGKAPQGEKVSPPGSGNQIPAAIQAR